MEEPQRRRGGRRAAGWTGSAWWKQELSVGRFKFAIPISHLGKVPSNDVSAGVPAGQRWGSTPLPPSLSEPEVGTVWALDKGLLREGMTEANRKRQIYNRPSFNHQRAAPSQNTASPRPETGTTSGNPRTHTNLPARASRSHFPGPMTQWAAHGRQPLS